MTQHPRLDLDHFFYAVKEEVYAIIKQTDLPIHQTGSDIDIFCYNTQHFAQKILHVANSYLAKGYTIKVQDKAGGHTYIDLFVGDVLEFRFDLYQELPSYQRIQLKPHYIFSVIENARPVQRQYKEQAYTIYVPSSVDDCLLRYVEYIEWYALRPDKVKHRDYIVQAVADDAERIKFLDKLHLYTAMPSYELEEPFLRRFYVFRWLDYWIKKLRAVPIKNLPFVVMRRLRNKLS